MKLSKGQHPRKDWINLGIAISNASDLTVHRDHYGTSGIRKRGDGEIRTLRDMAAFIQATIEVMGETRNSNFSWQAVSNIEQKTLRKLRVKFQFHHDPVLKEAVEHFCQK